jgi:hypothetical protein
MACDIKNLFMLFTFISMLHASSQPLGEDFAADCATSLLQTDFAVRAEHKKSSSLSTMDNCVQRQRVFGKLFPSGKLEDLDIWKDTALAALYADPEWQASEKSLSEEAKNLRRSSIGFLNPSAFLDAQGSMQILAKLEVDGICNMNKYRGNTYGYFRGGVWDSLTVCKNKSGKMQCSKPIRDPPELAGSWTKGWENDCEKRIRDEVAATAQLVGSGADVMETSHFGDFGGLQDPHAFTINGRGYAIANTWRLWIKSHCQSCSVRLVDLETFSVRPMRVANNSHCEKNWTPFVVNGELLITYGLFPTHEVLRCKMEDEVRCKSAYSSATKAFNQRAVSSDMSSIHGSTPYVDLDENYLIAVAHRYRVPRLANYTSRQYWHSFYTIERQPPYRVAANTQWFQFPNLESEANCETAQIQYAGGLVSTQPGHEDSELVVIFGMGDCHARSVRMKVRDVKQSLIFGEGFK